MVVKGVYLSSIYTNSVSQLCEMLVPGFMPLVHLLEGIASSIALNASLFEWHVFLID
jgi:hypothetical protein